VIPTFEGAIIMVFRANRLGAVVASATLAVGIWAATPVGAVSAAATVHSPDKSVSPSGSQVLSGYVANKSVMQKLPGDWLGPFPAPGTACDYEYAEWFLYATGSYTLTWNSESCGGSTSYGKYVVKGNLLTFYQQSVPGCPTCAQRLTIRVSFRFVTSSALRFCNYPSGSCYIYYRQH
jgi:hypothetical protein